MANDGGERRDSLDMTNEAFSCVQIDAQLKDQGGRIQNPKGRAFTVSFQGTDYG